MSRPANGGMLLAGDIGGTKIDLALFSKEAGPRAPFRSAEFHSAAYPSLEAVLREYLASVGVGVGRACFGVAGPVIRGRANITNLPWKVDAEQIRLELNLDRVDLLNDLEAIASAVPCLLPADLHTLNTGEAVTGGTIAVVAPGTGLGEAFLIWNGSAYIACPSEGGHADFSPTDANQIELLRYMLKRHDHVSAELVCSGIGISSLYAFLRDAGVAAETPEVARQLASAPDPNPVIARAALDPAAPCKLCRETLDLFVTILGAEAGNLALKVLATGGVYLAGGIPKRILPLIDNGNLLRAFARKGRLINLLAKIPVHVVVHRVGLLGAARYVLEGLSHAHATSLSQPSTGITDTSAERNCSSGEEA